MKKKLLMLVSLLLTACMATGCAYLPTMLSGDMLTGGSATTTSTSAESGDNVNISRE